MSLPELITWQEIQERLPAIFPPGAKNREHSIWEISAKTIFVMLYVGAVEGADRWIRPDQVTRMTDNQSSRHDEANRESWAKISVGGRSKVVGSWYAANTRESIRDDTIRYSLIPNAVVLERKGLAVTSPAPRYALHSDFVSLLAPNLDAPTFAAKATAWREKHLNPGALAKIAILRKGAVSAREDVYVTFPNKETRRMSPGQSTDITRAVIEDFAPKFLQKPCVVFLSESGNKVVARDDELAKAIGLNIPVDKNLPDIILVDVGPEPPLIVFIEVVWSDGPVNDERKAALLNITKEAGFSSQQVAFITAFLDRNSQQFRRMVNTIAWGSYVWFASEPEKLMALHDKPAVLGEL